MSQPTEEELKNMSPEEIAELQKQNCLFCKIIAGEIPSKKVYEDNDFLGVLDIYPANEGHVLLMPKQHVQVMPQMPPDMVSRLGVACKNISRKILDAFKAKGTSVFIANGLHAGQKAPHFMAHIVPRSDTDSVNLNPSLKEISKEDFEEVRSKLMGGQPAQPSPSGKEEEKEKKAEEKKEVKEEDEDKEGKKESEDDEEVIEKKKESEDEEKSDSDEKPDLDAVSKLFG